MGLFFCDLASKVIEIYESANKHTIYEKSEIENDFKYAGISKTEIFDHQGDLIGISWLE